MGFLDWVGDGTKWLNDRFNDAEQWASDIWHGNSGDQAVPAPELVRKVLASKGAADWHQGAASLGELAQDHDDVSSDVQQLSTSLESVWTGGGADAAQTRIRPLGDAASAAGQTYTGNAQNLTDLAHGFDEMKAALQPMPGTPPHKDFIDVATPWDTDTEDQINNYNKLAQENLDRYNGYAKQAQASGQGLKTDYGGLTTFDGQVTITSQDPATAESPHTSSNGTSGHTSARSDFTGTGTSTGTGTGTSNGNGTGGVAPSPSAGSSVLGNQLPPAGSTPPGVDPGASDQSDGGDTEAAGYVPPSVPDPRPGSTPPYSVPGPSTGSGAGSSWSPGSGSGFVPGGFGGSSPGSGGTTGRGLSGGPGGGARSGAGDEGLVRGSGGSAASRGAAGARGASGMGGMGAAGGKGKGEDDKEHQRKYGVEDDSAFSLTDDDGERLLDPRTGLPLTPPTIGG